jgi:peptidoglycan/LPS O-acetylase OafA/YrhL
MSCRQQVGNRSATQLYSLSFPTPDRALGGMFTFHQQVVAQGLLRILPCQADHRAWLLMSSQLNTREHFVATLFKSLDRDKPGIPNRLRDNNFDALRLLFASMVVLFHIGILTQAASLAWCLHISATFAVQAFFVVSGFLVTMSFEQSSSIKSYASKRLRRITPAYVVVILAAALGLSSISTLPWNAYFTDRELWRYLGFNLVLSNFSAPSLPGVFGSNFMTAVNGSLWTIKVEVAFYCLVPFMVWATQRVGARKVLTTMFVASVLWKIGFNVAAATTGAEIYSKLAKQLPGQLCFFAGGAWAYYRTRDGKSINGLAAAIGVIAYAISGGGWLYELTAPLAVTAIVYWAAIVGPRLPPVAKYGDFSYGVYLYHFPLIQTFIALGTFHWSPLAGWAISVATVGVSAVLSWHLVERTALHRSVAHS